MAETALLQQAFNFSTDDLQANRHGRLSARQKSRLSRRLYLLNATYIATGLFFFIAAMYLEPWALTIDDGRLWTAIGIIVLATVAVHHLLRESEDFAKDVRTGKVTRISGFVRREFSERSRDISTGGDFYIQIHDQRFYVPWQAYQAFEDRKKYTLYYLPTVRRVVAAEPSRWG